jgi:hypothetical protein
VFIGGSNAVDPFYSTRSNLRQNYTAEGMQIVSLDCAKAYMSGLTERARTTGGFELNTAHPWIIGVLPGNDSSSSLIFILGNIIRYGKETRAEVGYPTYENLNF